jgi:hypothetical protein
MNQFWLVTRYGGRYVSGKRKPRVMGTKQDVSVAEIPPPGPPRYELVKAWPPGRPPRKTLRSRLPVIVPSTVLAVVIAVLIMSSIIPLHQLISLTALATTVISTYTTTKVETITVTTTPAILHENYSAWLKIVTDSWDGTNYPGHLTPVKPAGIDFPGRYNVTNVCVELYRFINPARRNPAPLTHFERRFAGSPNATGFINISWPANWENVTVVVKAKSYYGECIGTENGSPFEGIIVYWLTFGRVSQSFYNKFISMHRSAVPGNYTIGDDGILKRHDTNFDWKIQAPFGSGPVDIVFYNSGPITFQSNHRDPRNAWVARAAYIFMLFHEHTWYDVKDNLTYSIIFIYDVDHTPADSPRSLLQAAITGNDGQSRYTREIYPSEQGSTGRFRDNKLVPIPLQTINRFNGTPFHGGIGEPSTNIRVGAPHLNATKRVWWETVLTNQTFYVGDRYKGGRYSPVQGTEYVRPLFGGFPADPAVSPTIAQGGITGIPAGPLSLALNHTVPKTDGLAWVSDNIDKVTNVVALGNNTVFYSRLCVWDSGNNPVANAKIILKSITSTDITDYSFHAKYTTADSDGCSKNGDNSKWPGYMDSYKDHIRFPNGTNWGKRGSLNASYFFIPTNDISPAWKAEGYFMQALQTSKANWMAPYNIAKNNYSALIPNITYMLTRTLIDDPRWGGFEIQITINDQVNYRVRFLNPYMIAYIIEKWIRPKPTDSTVMQDSLIIILERDRIIIKTK